MSIPSSAVKHPVTTTMIFAAFFVLGIISVQQIGQELFPDIELPSVIIITQSSGVGPEEIESTVTRPIENAVSGVAGVDSVSSNSADSVSQVFVSFVSGTNLDLSINDINEALAGARSRFPEGTNNPIIVRYNANMLPSLRLNIYTESAGINLRELVEDEIAPELEKIRGVAQTVVFGGQEEVVQINLDLDALNSYGLSVSSVARVFQVDNINIPAGTIRLDQSNLVLRTLGKFRSIEDVAALQIGRRDTVPIYLGDVSSISIRAKDQNEFFFVGEREGVRVSIRKQSGYNTVQVNEAVLGKIESLMGSLPPSIKVEIQEDQAVQVRGSIGGVGESAWQGGLLAIMVLLFFLRNIGSTVIISGVIPISVIATFSLINFGGMTLNMTSLMGITLAVGMFVDNAIVVLESIYRKQLSGLDPEAAAIAGAEEVSTAITASTLTTMAVFVPMLFVQGLAGFLFRDLSLTISFSLGVSLLAALMLVPVLCAKFLRVPPVSEELRTKIAQEHYELSLADVEVHTKSRLINRVSAAIQNFLRKLDGGYEKLLAKSLERWKLVLVVAVTLLAASLGTIALLGMEFLPEADEGAFSVEVETRVGAPFEYTTGKLREIEAIIRELSRPGEIGTIASLVGNGGSNYGTVDVRLNLKDDRSRSIWEISNEVMREVRARVVDVKTNLAIQGMAALATSVNGAAAPVVIRLKGENLEAMYYYGQRIADAMATVPGIQDPRVNYAFGKPELQFRIKRREAASLGLSPLEIASALRAAYNGLEAGTLTTEDGSEYDIQLILRPEDRNSLEKVSQITFTNPAGTPILLENVVELVEGEGPLNIQRINRTRYMDVVANTTGERALNRIVDDIRLQIDRLGAPPAGVELEMEGAASQMGESFSSLLFALVLAVALVYMVMASQFESFLNPLIIMASVPFSIIGLTAALLLTGTTFNILSFTGAILLVGIVVNNSIVLIDYYQTLRKKGLSVHDAILMGSRTRLKPILMTTSTTLLGLIPMALGFGAGAELRAPMGIAIVGGLMTSTLITLVLIPTLYWVVEGRIKPRLARRGGAA